MAELNFNALEKLSILELQAIKKHAHEKAEILKRTIAVTPYSAESTKELNKMSGLVSYWESVTQYSDGAIDYKVFGITGNPLTPPKQDQSYY